MRIQKWLDKNTSSLVGKSVAVTGSTGGLGRELCRYLAGLGASLILLDRNHSRSKEHGRALVSEFGIAVTCIRTELEDAESVETACETLERIGVDILILNAGAYSIPRHKCSTGFDNVFQINFVSHLLMVKKLLPHLRERHGRVIAVGSIAHTYSKADENDTDFSTRKSSALAYGNSKRYLMFSLYEMFKDETQVTLSVTHPGITFTNITAHYPKAVFAVIKHPMKIIFPDPRKASLCVLRGVFDPCGYYEWIGPCLFDIWGAPKKKRLHLASEEERRHIIRTAEKIR